jgi:chemotaxis protein MotB
MLRAIATGTAVLRAARAGLRLSPVLLLLGLPACVSSGRYQKLAAEHDALGQRLAALEQEKADLESERASLEENLHERKGEISEMRGTYDALLAELEQEVAAGKVQIEQLREGLRLNLAQDILFATGSAELDEQGRDVLGRVSEQLAKSNYRVEVEGHTDTLPIKGSLAKTYPSNWELAGARAARVVRLFEEKGVDRKSLAAVSFGEMHPVASNGDEASRARNRRIEIRLLPQESATVPAALDPSAAMP